MAEGDGPAQRDREPTTVEDAVPDGHAFALCLTHDVDRPYKTYQSLYYAVAERDPRHLASLLPGRNPYWRFADLMALEDDLGVRSAFYFLDEQHLLRDRPVRDWVVPANWKRYLGRYSLHDPAIREAVGDLADGGWEVGLHGSFESYRDPERLRAEKAAVEDVLRDASERANDDDATAANGGDATVLGGRQHYLNLDVPDTWAYQAAAGLGYDSSLGASDRVGFQYGYDPRRPFDDEFVVFPLTAMELALPDPGEEFEAAWQAVEDLLVEAHEHRAVMTVLWHPRMVAESEFPGYRRLYRWLVEAALSMDAWVGPPADLYRRLDHPERDGDGATTARGPDGDGAEPAGGSGSAGRATAATDAGGDGRRQGVTKADGREVTTGCGSND